MVEFALILPALLLVVMFGLDFGRVYLGWVNLQNMTRVAANFAANNANAWVAPGDATVKARYRQLVANDAKAINCTPQDPIPDPIFATGVDLGDLVSVEIDCRFRVVTPIIGAVLGNEVLVAGHSTFPIKSGIVGSVPGGGGGPVAAAPVADFVGSPASGYGPLTVAFTDKSTNGPTSWVWSFGDGGLSFRESPTYQYLAPGIYNVSLTSSNTGGADSMTRSAYIEVLAPPTTGPVPEFTATPRTGIVPPSLAVSFNDTSTGSPTSWLWNFGDGTATSTSQNPNHSYTAPGLYSVTLTVSDGSSTNSQTKRDFIVVDAKPCTVPNFASTRRNDAQSTWRAAGFTTTVTLRDAPGKGNANYLVNFQSLPGGQANPAGGCNAVIEVGP